MNCHRNLISEYCNCFQRFDLSVSIVINIKGLIHLAMFYIFFFFCMLGIVMAAIAQTTFNVDSYTNSITIFIEPIALATRFTASTELLWPELPELSGELQPE